MRRIAISVLEAGCLLMMSIVPANAQTLPTDLTQVSLEDLMHIQVTSVSRKEQPMSKAGAAVFVITAEDIRRSGATNIPDLLRMVPGVNVQQIDANSWAIGIRGFADVYADKVLVLVDGRSVYRPSFSGVNWDEQDMPLENIERIEVIRGPGGTVWGANAMNGVINITTKHAKDTQGGMITAGTGSETSVDGTVQYGGKIGSQGAYRAFGRYFNIESSVLPNGARAVDGWHGSHGGFRSDWDLSPQDSLTVQGDVLHNNEGQTLPGVVFPNALPSVRDVNDRIEFTEGNILGRWNHTLSNGSEMSLQAYEDYYNRSTAGIDENRNTADLDFQHHVAIGSRHDVVWGLGYRVTSDHFTPGYAITVLPPSRTDSLFSTFVQDEISITHSLTFIVGSKFEHNAYTGFEYEPGAQLVWEPTKRQTLWTSAARAIRQPSRRDYGMSMDFTVFPLGNNGFGVTQLVGQTHPKAEELRDFEVGYRAQVRKRLSLDAVAFASIYRHLMTMEPQAAIFTTSPGPPHMVIPMMFDYLAHAHDYGAEIYATWTVTDRWKLSPGLALLHMNIIQDPTSHGSPVDNEGNAPGRYFSSPLVTESDAPSGVGQQRIPCRQAQYDPGLSALGHALGVAPR